ncbi:MAG: GldG family protein, partial [Desulfatiglandales bacterium]|nr:GldG family protein [Desulfatiglandales bacterium]
AKRVREFLSEYEHVSRRKINVEVLDPKIDSDEEEWAQKYGLRAMQTAGGDNIYFGLVFLALDQEEKIELVDMSREELLEYDITLIIHRLQTFKKKVVGVISTLPVFGQPQSRVMPGRPGGARPWFFITEIKKTYEVREINLTADRIDPSLDLLIVVHPMKIGPKLEYAIDQYVLSGGNALLFVDPLSLSDVSQPRQPFMPPSGSSLNRLFAAWGISMEPAKTVADLDNATRVRAPNNRVEENPVLISVVGGGFAESNVVTSGLEKMLFPMAGAIKKTPESIYDFEPMVQSGENAAMIEAFKANFGAGAIRRDFIPAGKRFNLVAQVRGKFKSAFPEGPPKDEKPDVDSLKGLEKDHLNTGKEEAVLIIVADADMLADQFYVQRSNFLGFPISNVFNDNLNFLSNATEILTGSNDLIGLRSRGKFERPFTAVLELKRRAQERWLAKEKELVKRVEDTNQKLRKMEQQKDSSQRSILSPEQEAAIAKFREERREINRELKEVRKNLRADIETLGTTLKGINIFLMPFLVSMAGIVFAIYRQRRMRK